jgi:hypothetical protein
MNRSRQVKLRLHSQAPAHAHLLPMAPGIAAVLDRKGNGQKQRATDTTRAAARSLQESLDCVSPSCNGRPGRHKELTREAALRGPPSSTERETASLCRTTLQPTQGNGVGWAQVLDSPLANPFGAILAQNFGGTSARRLWASAVLGGECRGVT